MKKGFTLIELLVVVLIIGILAAVALPQYKKAVDKAKAGRLLSNLRAAGNAVDLYYMENGQLPKVWEDLALDFSAGYYCDSAGKTPASSGCNSNKFYSKDGSFRLLTGYVQVIPFLEGEKMSTVAGNADIYFLFYPSAYATTKDGSKYPGRVGKMVCQANTEYGQKLCSTFGKENSDLGKIGIRGSSYWF